MEIFQELTFTAFVALILSFIVAKIVSFAVSYSPPTDRSCDDEVGLGKDGALVKGEKRVKFVDDYSVDCFGSIRGQEMNQEQCFVVDDDVGNDDGGDVVGFFGSIGDGILEGFDPVGDNKLSQEQCFVVDDDQAGMSVEGFGAEEENSVPQKSESVMIDQGNNDEVVELMRSDRAFNVASDHKEEENEKGDRVVACEENDVVKKEGVVVDDDDDGAVKNEGVVVDDNDDDDWEGIERSELEKVFAEAVNYVECGEKSDDRMAKLSSDVSMNLYGLHKVALEGPCHDPQPMALKVSARAKWNAWQRHGSMTREAAMEHYLALLSHTIPAWNSPKSKVLPGQDGGLSSQELSHASSF